MSFQWCHGCVPPWGYCDLLDQWGGGWRAGTKSTGTTARICFLQHCTTIPFWSLRGQLPLVYHSPQWDLDSIRLHINHRRITNLRVHWGCVGASWVHEILSAVHHGIGKHHNADYRPTTESREFRHIWTGQMGMDSWCRPGVLELEKSLYWCTHPQALRHSWAYYPVNWCNRIWRSPIFSTSTAVSGSSPQSTSTHEINQVQSSSTTCMIGRS